MTAQDGHHELMDRFDASEVRLWSELYALAPPHLRAGSAPVDGALATWSPRDEDTGFNCLIAADRTSDPAAAWPAALALARQAGCQAFGLAISRRGERWATPDRLAGLALEHASDEVVWAAPLHRLPVRESTLDPAFTIETGPFDPNWYARTINHCWELPPDHPRGALYSGGLRVPTWRHYVAKRGDEIAGVSILGFVDEISWLLLALVRPEHRGHGLQSEFIRRRLLDASASGAEFAFSETIDDNASPRNLQRQGFELIERRRVFARRL